MTHRLPIDTFTKLTYTQLFQDLGLRKDDLRLNNTGLYSKVKVEKDFPKDSETEPRGP